MAPINEQVQPPAGGKRKRQNPSNGRKQSKAGRTQQTPQTPRTPRTPEEEAVAAEAYLAKELPKTPSMIGFQTPPGAVSKILSYHRFAVGGQWPTLKVHDFVNEKYAEWTHGVEDCLKGRRFLNCNQAEKAIRATHGKIYQSTGGQEWKKRLFDENGERVFFTAAEIEKEEAKNKKEEEAKKEKEEEAPAS
jgi:hypothetical protein